MRVQWEGSGGVAIVTARVVLQGLRVEVTDPTGNKVLQRDLELQGRFAFTSTAGGEHVLCFGTNTSLWFGEAPKLVRSMPFAELPVSLA